MADDVPDVRHMAFDFSLPSLAPALVLFLAILENTRRASTTSLLRAYFFWLIPGSSRSRRRPPMILNFHFLRSPLRCLRWCCFWLFWKIRGVRRRLLFRGLTSSG
jgi:hypothetical protein